ncbi:MAG TPA: TIGR03435 family protein [Terriglobia bacterium]|jgi:uncharacterized protein (TIGR03435 family)
MRHALTTSTLILCLLSLTVIAVAQNQPLKFEVALVKVANPRSGIDMRTFPGGRLLATNCTLKQLIMGAYGLKEQYQVVGGPTWVDVDRFEVEGKAAEDLTNDPDRVIALGREAPRKLTLMLQTLLAVRFKLSAHQETRQNTAYRLVVAKSGPKLLPTTDSTQEPFIGVEREGPVTRPATGLAMFGKNASMTLLAERLARSLVGPVINETGLKGNFDFRFEYAADETQQDQGPSIFTAIQQLGLNLEAAKGPVDILVIDHAEKPDAN